MSEKLLNSENMDTSVRPQDDLYRYVNGQWLDKHEIPADRASDGAFYQLRDESLEACHELVKECDPESADHEERLLAQIYQTFMDEDAVEAAGIKPLEADFRAIDRATDKDSLTEVIGDLEFAFFESGAEIDSDNPDRYRYLFYQGGLSLPDESYYREESYEEVRQAFKAHVTKMAELAGFADPQSFTETVWEVESALAKEHWDIVQCRDVLKTHNNMTLAEFVETAPGFGWNEWLKALSPHTEVIEDVQIYQPSFFTNAAKLWQDLPLESWKVWAKWRVLTGNASLLSKAFSEENFNFYSRTLTGAQEQRPRWKRAVSMVESCVGEALGKRYVAKHFPPSHKAAIEQLVADLIEAYRQSISELDWMGEETRQRALDKLAQFTPKIGYPTKWEDYSSLHLEGADLVEISRRTSRFNTDLELKRLPEPVDRTRWLMTPQTVNAYYYPVQNEIVFPAAILQPPFFDPQWPAAINYGAIGAVIGHEIGHGFDDQGAKFDGTGRINDWWQPEDQQRFEERTKALIDQYNVLSPANLDDSQTVNGALTIGENIGDLGGLSIAYKAWLIALKRDGIDSVTDAPEVEEIPAAQAFFYSWARIWRAKNHPELAALLLATDPHSPAEFRCNAVASNMDAFAEAFAVTESDGMWRDPADRVKIW